MKKEVIVITIPAYNEEKSIDSVIQDIKKTMDDTPYEYKILVYICTTK